MSKFSLAFLLFFISLLSQAQQLLNVVDAENNEPIPFANISVADGKSSFHTTTNSEGLANIIPLKNYTGTINISSLGYKPVNFTYEALQKMGWIVRLHLTNLALDQVVVSASRYSQPKSNAPMKVSAISPKEVAFQNPQTAADLLNISGEVFIQKSQQGGGSPMIRGFATNRILITVDGVRMNNAIFRSGNVQNIISVDPFSVSRTEILFGPNSIIYGSDAIGGVISFYTLTPQLRISGAKNPFVKGNVVTRYATASNEFTGHFDINLGWKKFGFVMSATHSTFDDLHMGKNGPDDYLRTFYVERRNNKDFMITNENPEIQTPTGYSQNNILAKFLYKPTSTWDFTYAFNYSNTSTYSRYDRLLVLEDDLPKSAEWFYGPQLWIMNNLKIHNIANNDLFDEFTLRFAQQTFEESRIDRNFNDVNRRTRTENVLALSLNADFVKSLGKKNSFFYGAEFVFNDVNSVGENTDISTGLKTPESARYPLSQWYSYAAYLTYQYKINPHFMLHGGLRYNHFILDADYTNNALFYPLPYTTSTTNNGALTGSVGIDYNPSAQWTFSAVLSSGFRNPNVDDIGKLFDSEPGNVMIPNPNLKAEYAYNAEIDVAKVFGDFLKVDVAVFYTYLENAMVRRNGSYLGMDSIVYDGVMSQVQTLKNAAVAYVYGTEVGLEMDLPAGFTLSSRYNFQKGVEELDDGSTAALRHAAPQFGQTKLGYLYKKLTVEFYAIYSGKMDFEDLPPSEVNKAYLYAKDENGNPYSPSWYTLNVKCQYKINPHLLVTAGLENITNQRYRPYSSGLAAPGLNFILALKASL